MSYLLRQIKFTGYTVWLSSSPIDFRLKTVCCLVSIFAIYHSNDKDQKTKEECKKSQCLKERERGKWIYKERVVEDEGMARLHNHPKGYFFSDLL